VPPNNLSLSYQTYRIPSEFSYLLNVPTGGINNCLRLKKSIIELDKYINKLTNGKYFDLNIPHSKNFLYQVLLTNLKCNNLYYIDEGLLSYTDNFHKQKFTGKINWLTFLLKLLYRERTNVYRSIHKNYTALYLFVKVKNQIPQKQQISWPSMDINQSTNLTNQKVMILDNPVNGGVCKEEDYINYFKQISFRFGGEMLYLKTHPRDSKIKLILQILESYEIKYSIIDKTEVLELALLNSKNVTVIGGWSSILLYSSSMGHEVISFIPTIIKNSVEAKNWIKHNIPDVFYNSEIKLM
jgi:hypothetical protein